MHRNRFCWPNDLDLTTPEGRLRAFANWYTVRYGILGPDQETKHAPRKLETPTQCVWLTQFYNRVYGTPLEELTVNMGREWPVLWSAYLKSDIPDLLETSSRELLRHLDGREELLDQILLFLLRIDLRDQEVEADLTRLRDAFPRLIFDWEAMIYTGREFKWRMTRACFEKLTELIPPGLTHIGMSSTLQVGQAVEEGLWQGMLPVACRYVSGGTGALGWTYPARVARGEKSEHQSEAFSVFYSWDDLGITAGLLAHGADTLLSAAGLLGGLTRDVLHGYEDRETLTEDLFGSQRASVLDHEVGHHFFNVQRKQEGRAWSDNWYGEMIVNELMAELFALKESVRRGEADVLLQRFLRVERYSRQKGKLDLSANHVYHWASSGTYQAFVLRSLFSDNPVTKLEAYVDRFLARLERAEPHEQYAEWAAAELRRAVRELPH